MDPADLRAFASRNWSAIAASKRTYWADLYQREGPRVTVEASRALLLEMSRVRPDYPTPDDRRADLDSHVRLQTLLERAAHAFTGR